MDKQDAIELNGQSLKAGDEVKVLNREGSTEKYLRGEFTFVALVTNDSGSQWIDVIGGRKATVKHGPERKFRSFTVDRIEAIQEKKKRGKTKG